MCKRVSSSGTIDSIKFDGNLNNNEGDGEALVNLRVHYFQNSNDTTSMQNLHVKLYSILEYVPESTSSIGYTSGATLKQEWKPDWTSWGGNRGVGYLQFEATANTTSGTLIVRAYIATNDTNVGVNKVALDANHVKFDVEIKNFPYVATSGSYLALKTKIGTLKGDLSQNKGQKDGSYTFTTSTSAIQGAFTFQDFVNMTSGTASIVHTSASPYDYFAVDSSSQPSYVLWDPTIGYEAADSGATAIGLSFVALFAVLVAVFF